MAFRTRWLAGLFLAAALGCSSKSSDGGGASVPACNDRPQITSISGPAAVTEGTTVTLTASVTDPDAGVAGCGTTALAYLWTLTSKPAASGAWIQHPDSETAQFVPDAPGAYQVELVVTDATGLASAPRFFTVATSTCGVAKPTIGSLSASPPVPNAGQLVTLQASGIVDPNACGPIAVTPFVYEWSLLSAPKGSQARLSSQTAATPSLVPDVPNGAYELALTVTDQLGNVSDPAFLTLTTSGCGAVPPTVRLVPGPVQVPDFTLSQDLAVNGGASLHLVHASDPTRNLASGAGTTVVPLYPGVPVQLAANVDPGADACAPVKTVSYAWSIAAQPPGSAARIANPAAQAPSFTPDLPGAYDFQLTLTDELGLSSTSTLSVDASGLAHPGTVGACGLRAPVAVASVTGPIPPAAGVVPSEPVGLRTQLDASGSFSPDDYRVSPYPAGCGLVRTLTYAWAITAAPADSTALIDSPTWVDPSFVLDQPGRYAVTVVASDGARSAAGTLAVQGIGGYTSAPAATGAVLTSTTVDGSGNPVVAFWDNAAGTVSAAQCTAGCASANPVWTSLGTIDGGLGPMTFLPDDEPRPLSVLSAPGGILVAYYTGHQAGAPTVTSAGQPFCGLALARWLGGTGWSHQTVATGSACDAAAFGAGTQSGRYVSLVATSGGLPAIGYWRQLGPTQSEPHYVPCADAACSSYGADVAIMTAGPSTRFGRWISLVAEPSGAVDAAWYVDDNSAGARFPAFSTSPSSSAPTFSSFPIENPVAGVDAGRFTSLATVGPATPANPGATRELVVAYRDATHAMARLASCSVATCAAWTAGPIPDPASSDYGADTVLAVDPATGHARLAYVDRTHGVLRVTAGDAPASFSPIAEFPASASPGVSIAFGSGTGIAYGLSGLRFFAGP